MKICHAAEKDIEQMMKIYEFACHFMAEHGNPDFSLYVILKFRHTVSTYSIALSITVRYHKCNSYDGIL